MGFRNWDLGISELLCSMIGRPAANSEINPKSRIPNFLCVLWGEKGFCIKGFRGSAMSPLGSTRRSILCGTLPYSPRALCQHQYSLRTAGSFPVPAVKRFGPSRPAAPDTGSLRGSQPTPGRITGPSHDSTALIQTPARRSGWGSSEQLN